MRLHSLWLLAFLVSGLVPAAHAQDEGLFSTFNLDQLWFRFYPAGLGDSAAGTTGSGLSVFAENVHVEGADAVDLRHCIDGWPEPDCSYGALLSHFTRGNQNGIVEPSEVASFESVATLGARQIDAVDRLAKMLQNNITVDGLAGKSPKVVGFVVRSAEGDVNSTAPAFIDVTMEVGYDNDKSVRRHELRAQNLFLEAEGFTYTTAAWRVVADAKWAFKPGDTQPSTMQGKVTKQGWDSTQADLELATSNGLVLVVEQVKNHRAPGFEGTLAALALALGIALRGKFAA